MAPTGLKSIVPLNSSTKALSAVKINEVANDPIAGTECGFVCFVARTSIVWSRAGAACQVPIFGIDLCPVGAADTADMLIELLPPLVECSIQNAIHCLHSPRDRRNALLQRNFIPFLWHADIGIVLPWIVHPKNWSASLSHDLGESQVFTAM